jgi:hypothetical protein
MTLQRDLLGVNFISEEGFSLGLGNKEEVIGALVRGPFRFSQHIITSR